MNKFISLLFSVIIMFLVSDKLVSQDTDTHDSILIDSSEVDSSSIGRELISLKIGDLSVGNKSVPVHLIKLYDQNGFSIHPNDEYMLPFSTKNTCGDCHSYDLIKDGTHFSIDVPDSTNRSGEPFIYINHRALTAIPLSYRSWNGTVRPGSIGLTQFDFLKRFGSHLAGGNITENEDLENIDNYLRWLVSGKLEINCLVCHDADSEYDQAEFAKQIGNENFCWATAASSSIASVKGYANKMPDNFDIYNTNTYVDVDLRTTPPPTIIYDSKKFDDDNKVFLDITKNIDNKRCLYCHSSTINSESEKFIFEQEDVHISSGMSCVDCHKNGMNHEIISGYAEEYIDKKYEQLYSFSCEGCHISSNENNFAGRYGAPKPLHEGIPKVHFERLSCTVCHSSFLPDESTKIVKTSRSHKLGVPGPNKMPSTFPLIQSPIFVRSEKGKIEPRNLIWPSYWAIKNGNELKPLDITFVEENIQPLLRLDSVYNFGEWPKLSDSSLVAVIDSTNRLYKSDGSVVFISGGKLHQLSDGGRIESSEIEEANAYTWPIAHNVRPSQQSLGINGCDDCHSLNSNFYFSEIEVISSLRSNERTTISMINYQGLNTVYQLLFSFSFYFRPFLKLLLILSTIIISLITLSYVLRGMKSITEYVYNESGKNDENKL